jgi:hypothetical protein
MKALVLAGGSGCACVPFGTVESHIGAHTSIGQA